jgi:hypothetical protein
VSRLSTSLVVAVGLALLLSACDGAPAQDPDPTSGGDPALSGSWEPAPDTPFVGSLAGRVGVPASDQVVVSITLRNARFTAIPDACVASTVVRRASRLTQGNARLLCTLQESTAERTIEFAAVAVGAKGQEMGGTIRNTADDSEIDLPALVIDEAPTSLSPRLRLQHRDRFARHDLSALGGRPRFTVRPLPDVQVITIDSFNVTADRLRRVLRNAQRDQVRWIIVQGQLPILGPVRTRGSTGRYLSGGADSDAWQLFEKYGVDLYLSGEAQDVTVLRHGAVTQVAHGGPVARGPTTALLIDFYDDYVYVTLRDYDRREAPYVVGTGVVRDTGGLQLETGMLRPRL